MAEKSYFWTTGVSGDGLATYTQVDLQRAMEVVAACFGRIGVAQGLLNMLAGSVPGANTVNIATGGAMVDGRPYYNDASVAVNIPSSTAGNERIDRVVLRANWSARTVRVFRIEGTSSQTPFPPNLTQISGTTWDLPLYQARVNSAGTVTLTDERQVASPLVRRRGGVANDWSVPGNVTYPVGLFDIQVGAGTITFFGGSFAQITVNFPAVFADVPIVFCTIDNSAGYGFNVHMHPRDVTQTSFIAEGATGDNSQLNYSFPFFWLAIGPRS